MTWYIANKITHGYHGLGHMFYMHLTPYIIALIFDLEHLSTPFITGSDERHDGRSRNFLSAQKRISTTNWENFFNFGKGEELLSHLGDCKKITLPLKKPFLSYGLPELRKFFDKYDRNENLIFLVQNSNRILPGEFQSWCMTDEVPRNLYARFIMNLREKCIYKSKIISGLLVVHIRRGDAPRLPLDYYKRVLDMVLMDAKVFKIVILSLGTSAQMAAIKTYFQKHFIEKKDILVSFQLNIDAIDSFRIMMDAEILIGGYSSFPKVAGLYSDGKKYFVPFTLTNGGEIPSYDSNWTNVSE